MKRMIGGLEVLTFEPTTDLTDVTPVVVVPGASATGIMGEYIAQTLAGQGRLVHLVSLSGHGGSGLWDGKPLGQHSLEDFSQGLGAFFEALSQRVDVWGHSLGGAVVQKQFASGRIRNATLIASVVPRIPLVSRPDVARRALKYWKEMIFWRPFSYGEEDYISLLCNETPAEEARALFRKTVLESGRAIGQVCTGWFRPPSAVRIEQLVVASSTHDLVTPGYMARLLHKKYRRHCPTRHMVIEGDHVRIFTKAGQAAVSALEQVFN